MSKDISLKNTKNEILEAYSQALMDIKKLKQTSQRQLKEQSERKEIIAKASSSDKQSLQENLNEIKQTINSSFDELATTLLNKNEKLLSVQNALKIQQENLQESYDLQIQLESLEALILANKKTQHEINTEVNKQRDTFKNERLQLEQSNKDYKEKLELKRQREEEEYQYTRNITIKKEQHEINEQLESVKKEIQDKSQAFETEIASREQAVIENENKVKSLQKQVDDFPNTLQSAIDDAVKQTSATLNMQFEYQAKLKESDMQAKISLLQQTNQSLNKTIEEQKLVINKLSEKSSYAQDQVQNIALKAIEGASQSSKYFSFDRKSSELGAVDISSRKP